MSRERCKAVKSPDSKQDDSQPSSLFSGNCGIIPGWAKLPRPKSRTLHSMDTSVGTTWPGQSVPPKNQSAIFGIAFIADHYNHVFHV
jgi:hypothetical protein